MRSLRARFTFAAAAVVAVVVTGVGVAVEIAYPASLRSGLDNHLDQVTQVVSDGLSASGANSSGLATILKAGRSGPVSGTAVITWNGSATPLSATARQIDFAIPSPAWTNSGSPQYLDITAVKPNGGDTTFRFEVVTVAAPHVSASKATTTPTAVAVGLTEDSIDSAVRQLSVVLAVAALAGLVTAGGAGYLISRRVVQPVTRLITAVEAVASDGDLSMRVPETGTAAETDRLSRSFNESLARIEVMYQALETVIIKQRRFVADASHELRTPLTTVSSCLEMVHHFPDMAPSQRTVVIDDALHEARQMAGLVDDLLTLALMDSGDRHKRKMFEWQELIEPWIVDARAALAPRQMKVDVAAGLGSGVGDVRALRHLLDILTKNVVAHTPEDATPVISIRRAGENVVLTVSDDGPGVPEAMLSRIFERFVRVDPSRQGSATGLGLAVAQAIVVGHGGEVVARNVAPHGLAVEVTLPPLTATPDRRRAPRPKRSTAPGNEVGQTT